MASRRRPARYAGTRRRARRCLRGWPDSRRRPCPCPFSLGRLMIGDALSETGSAPVIRVVLADDHPVVRAGLAALLTSLPGIDVVGVAATGREAVREVITSRPDVAVLDLQMPDLDGFAATREIARTAPDVAVLVLTMFEDDDSVFAAMR